MQIKALILSTMTALMMLPASAQEVPSDPGDILGSWSFKTNLYRDGLCRMSGVMRVTSNKEPGLYQCELTAVEKCEGFDRSVVVQSCEARRFGNQVSVRSNIEQFLESHNNGLTYVPDNFALTVQSSKRMYGSLVSAVTAPAEFMREEDAIS